MFRRAKILFSSASSDLYSELTQCDVHRVDSSSFHFHPIDMKEVSHRQLLLDNSNFVELTPDRVYPQSQQS